MIDNDPDNLTNPDLYRQTGVVDEPVGGVEVQVHCGWTADMYADTELVLFSLHGVVTLHVNGLELF